MALIVYAWLGLTFISRSWVNLDLVWAASLILIGVHRARDGLISADETVRAESGRRVASTLGPACNHTGCRARWCLETLHGARHLHLDGNAPVAGQAGTGRFARQGQVHDRTEQFVPSGPAAARHRGVSAHDRAAVRRAREERARARGGDEGRQADPARQPEGRVGGRAEGRRHLSRRRARQRAAAAEAARRHGQGAGRGQGPGAHRPLPRQRRLFRGRGRADRGDREGRGGDQGAVPRRRRGVRALRQAEPQHPRGGGGGDLGFDAGGEARRHRRRAPGRQARGEAEAAGGAGRRRPAGGDLRPDAGRDERAEGREEDQEPRQDPDGAHAARVLPERADEGDPARARRRGRGPGRRGGVRGADRQDQALEGGARQGDRRAEEAAVDVADVGRGDGGAQLPRLDAVDPLGEEVEDPQGSRPRAEGARRRPLRAREGQGPDRRVPGGAVALGQAEGADPLPRRAAGRRQDLARQVGGAGDGPRVHPHLARRRPGRGGDPRAPADLHRLDARQDHPVDEEGEDGQPADPARRDRQDGPGLPRRSRERDARGARPGAELDLLGPLPGGGVRPLPGDVHHHGQQLQHAAAAARPHGDHLDLRLHRGREGRHRAACT